MVQQLRFGDITAELVQKDIRTLRVTVYSPNGLVRISAPRRMPLEAVHAFVNSRLGWIKRHRSQFRQQVRAPVLRFVDGESHALWGKPCSLDIWLADAPPIVEKRGRKIMLQIRPGTRMDKRRELVERWYRDQIKEALPAMLARWEPRMGVSVRHVYVQRMKTKWGTCNPRARTIRINTELVHKHPRSLEYIVVHELAHLLETSHDYRFEAVMDRFMPKWRKLRDELNRDASPNAPLG